MAEADESKAAVSGGDSEQSTMIAEALASIRGKVATACKTAGRDNVRLVAVSKLKSNECVMAAYDQGQRHFGENYVQELVKKAGELPSDIEWRFIGQLQSNKCNTLVKGVPNLRAVESVGSKKLANKLNNACVAAGREKPLEVFVQINTSDEPQKGGVAPSECTGLVKHVQTECPHLSFQGLMTIGKFGEVAAKYFETLAECRATTCADLGLEESDVELSMGMSSDFEMAIEYGSTNVRVGSSIFGART